MKVIINNLYVKNIQFTYSWLIRAKKLISFHWYEYAYNN